MQDDHYNIGKNLADRGWRDMRKLLDAELPVAEKKRRRFAGWWWLGVLVGMAAGGFAVVKFLSERPAQPEKATMPVAVLPKSTEKTPAVASPEILNNENIAGNLPADPAESATVPASVSKKNYRGGKNPTAKTKEVFSEIISSPSISYEQTGKEVFSENTNHSDRKFDEEPIRTSAPAQPATLEILKMLPPRPLAVSEEKTAGVPAQTSRSKRAHFSVFGSGLTSADGASSGFSFGALVSTGIKKSRWAMEAGAGYSFIQQPLSVVFLAETSGGQTPANNSFNDFNAVLGDVEAARVQGLASNSARLLKKLQLSYLDIPVAARYRLSHRISLRAGVNASVLLASSSDYATGGLFSNSFKFGSAQDEDASLLEDYSGEAPTVKLNKFDFAAIAGADYHISRRLAAGAGYRFSFSDLIPDNGTGDFNRLFQVFIRYSWRR